MKEYVCGKTGMYIAELEAVNTATRSSV